MTIWGEVAWWLVGRKDVALWAETGPRCHCISTGPCEPGAARRARRHLGAQGTGGARRATE
eukprot:5218452-Alexandrium_andersonii.AAC.1